MLPRQRAFRARRTTTCWSAEFRAKSSKARARCIRRRFHRGGGKRTRVRLPAINRKQFEALQPPGEMTATLERFAKKRPEPKSAGTRGGSGWHPPRLGRHATAASLVERG